MTAGVYIRKSREEADKPAHRLEAQREQLPAHAAAQGWHPVVYDEGYASAARGATLPQRDRLEAAIRAGGIGVVLVMELSRLSRDATLQDYVGWLALCSEHSTRLATPARVLDPAQPSDWMLLLLEGGFSSVEVRTTRTRMAEGFARAYESGAFYGGRVPFGYRLGRAGVEVDPEAAAWVREMYARLAAGVPAREVAATIGRGNVRHVGRLRTERVLDWYLARRRSRARPGQWIPCQWEPLIDEETARRVLLGRGVRPAKRPELGALLRGLIRCGHCNARAYPIQERHGTWYYRCQKLLPGSARMHRVCQRSRVWGPLADELVARDLLGRLDPALLRAAAEQVGVTGHGVELARLEAAETELAAQRSRLVDAIAEGILTKTDARRKLSEIEQARAAGLARRHELLEEAAAAPDWSRLAELPQIWDRATLAERREILAPLLKIYIADRHLYLHYRWLPDPVEIALPLPHPGKRWINRNPPP